MPYCSNCRTFIPDGVDTCPKCGTKDPRYSTAQQINPPPVQPTVSSGSGKSFVQLLKKILKTEDKTATFDSSDISTNSNNAVLAYLGPLAIIPLITARKSKFAMFHCCQGLMNSIFGVLYLIIMQEVLNFLPSLLALLLLIPSFIVLALFPISLLLGIVHAIRGKAVTLPVFGRIDLMRILFKNL